MRTREPASLAGKRGSLRHSTTSFSENVDVTEKSYVNYQVLGNFIILRPGEGLKNRANFSGEKKYNKVFWGVHFLRTRGKTSS